MGKGSKEGEYFPQDTPTKLPCSPATRGSVLMAEKRPKERDEPSVAHPAESVQIGTIEFSAERDLLVPAMLAVQKALSTVAHDSTGEVKKGGVLQYTYDYTSLGGVLEPLKSAMHDNDLLLVQGAGGKGDVSVTTCAMHVSGQWAQTTLTISSSGAAQAYGSGMSYGRRYGPFALFALVAKDDDGLQAQRSIEPEPEALTTDMLLRLPEDHRGIIQELGWTTGKCKATLAKFVDSTGTVNAKKSLAFLNRELDKQNQE